MGLGDKAGERSGHRFWVTGTGKPAHADIDTGRHEGRGLFRGHDPVLQEAAADA
jgi:hypothetical protein